jgi:hypothetical protein
MSMRTPCTSERDRERHCNSSLVDKRLCSSPFALPDPFFFFSTVPVLGKIGAEEVTKPAHRGRKGTPAGREFKTAASVVGSRHLQATAPGATQWHVRVYAHSRSLTHLPTCRRARSPRSCCCAKACRSKRQAISCRPPPTTTPGARFRQRLVSGSNNYTL